MNRRAVLRGAGVVLAAGALGGCLGGADRPARGSTERTTTDGSTTTTGQSSSMDSGGATTESADRGCTVDDVTVSQPGDEYLVTVDDDAAQSHPVTLANGTDCEARVDAAAWRLERKTSSGWSTIETGEAGETRRLGPGDDHDWSLSVEPHPTPGPRTTETTYVFFEGAPEGSYAFTVRGTVERSDAEASFTKRVEFTLRKVGGTTTASA